MPDMIIWHRFEISIPIIIAFDMNMCKIRNQFSYSLKDEYGELVIFKLSISHLQGLTWFKSNLNYINKIWMSNRYN